VTFKHAKGDLV